HHLKELLETAKIVPAVNQVEFSPYLVRKDLLEFCRSQGIQLEAYSPLTKGRKLKDPKLVSIGSKYSKTPAQILIRWALEHQIVVIPKSTNKGRIYENANVFDFNISEEDINLLNSFDEGLTTGWDPTNAP
ncbi:MAG: aldo/keto reductase, partial [Promethearchaeota archaeon]